jgi:signal transduction histidine kinase
MDLNNLKLKTEKDFNNAMCVVGLSQIWVFVYLLIEELASYGVLTGQAKAVIVITMSVLLLGIVTSRKILWAIIEQLFDFNKKILQLKDELLEKNRLAAITETTLTLSHEINNPLLMMSGNIEMLENDLRENKVPGHVMEKISKLKSHCEHIRGITSKLSHLSRPTTATVHGDIRMIDTGSSA